MKIHRLTRFKTIYSFNNNNNNNDSPVLISGHVMKSQQHGVAGMRNALKLRQLKAPYWTQPE